MKMVYAGYELFALDKCSAVHTHLISLADELLDTGVQTMSKEPALVDEEGEEEESINQVRTACAEYCFN